jgi:hypothetical protein
LLLADGTGPTDLGLAFTNDTNTGFWRSGTDQVMWAAGGANQWYMDTSKYSPVTGDADDIGVGNTPVKSLYLSRSIQGGKTVTLTETTATDLVSIAVPDGEFVEYQIRWTAFASDGTDHQTVSGTNVVSCVNKADTETCASQSLHTDANAVSAGTFTCTDATGTGTNAVTFSLDCTSSLTQTTLDAYYRLDMLNPQTVTPQ